MLSSNSRASQPAVNNELQDAFDANPSVSVAILQPSTVNNATADSSTSAAALSSSNNQDRLFFAAAPTGRHLGPPPSYYEANDPNAPPPSYDSLFGRVREVRKSSNGFMDFIKNLFFYLLGKIGLLVMVGITVIVPFCMLTIGSYYVKSCPAENYIPVYLIVGGIFGLLKQLLSLKLSRSRRSRQDEMEVSDSSFAASLQSLINSFLLCWFITGCYWVYHAYDSNFEDPNAANYCNIVLYTFAFWLLTSTFIFFGAVLLMLCCISSIALLLTRD